MDYNNMNKRASRSAYNYDNDRRVSKTVNNKRRENNADFSDFKKKRPVSPNPQVRYSAPNQTASHSARRPSQNHPQRKTNNPAEFNQQRPQNVRKKNQNSNNKNKGKRAPASPQKRGDWVYPEGYTPQRPPQMNRRPAQSQQRQQRPHNKTQRRHQPRKKSAPAIRIHIDWQKVGAICSAVLIRFVCCVMVVAIAFAGYYYVNFHTEEKPPVEEVKYLFATVSGEGDKQTTTYNELISSGALSYDRDQLLISFSEVSKWLGSAQVGDIYSMRFVVGSDKESQTVVFHNASQDAFVNGCPIVMKCRAQFRHGEVWVPVSFIKDYITGIEIKEKKDTVTLSLNGEELSFTLSPSNPIEAVPTPEDEE